MADEAEQSAQEPTGQEAEVAELARHRSPSGGDLLGADVKPPEIEVRRRQPEVERLDQLSGEKLLDEQLRRIWHATHDRFPVTEGDQARGWAIVREALADIRSAKLIGEAILSGRPGSIREDSAALEGDVSTVHLLVTTAVEQASGEELLDFIGTTLAATVTRLEREGQANRERISDIVLAALTRLRGHPRTAEVLPALFGYLVQDETRAGTGLFMTAAQIGQMLSDVAPPTSERQSAFIYHSVLRGVWLGLSNGRIQFDRSTQELISKSAGNLGILVWRLVDPRSRNNAFRATERRSGGRERIPRMLRGIGAANARKLPVEDALGSRILDALGIDRYDAGEALSALENMGALAHAWSGTDLPSTARLEASSAVVAAAAGDVLTVAPRLYNAAVSLRWSDQVATPPYIRCRLALNALGLRWTLWSAQDGDLVDALARLEGLDCAVSILSDMQGLQEAAEPDGPLWSGLQSFAELVGALPRQLRPVERLMVPLARVSQLTRRLGITPSEGRIDTGGLGAALEQVLAAFQPGRPAPATLEDRLISTAVLIRFLFEELIGVPEWDAAARIDKLIEARSRPLETFLELYRELVEPLNDPIGSGPLLAVDACTPEEWRRLGDGLRRDPGEIAPYLVALVGALREGR